MSFLPHADTGMCVLYVLLHILSSSPRCAMHSHAVVTHHQSPTGTCSAAAPQTQSAAHLQETSCSHQPERTRFWETQRGLPRSKSKTGVRRSCSSGSLMVLPGHCHRSARRQHATLRFCWKPSPSHLAPCTETLGLPSSPGIKAVEPCHYIGMEREQSNENLQQQNGSSRELLQKRLC